MISEDKVKLLNGETVEKKNGIFPAFSEVSSMSSPCDVCPMNHICSENHWLQCHAIEMFSGLEIEVDKLGRAV